MPTRTLEQTDSDQNRKRVLAAGGMLGAVLASTCCIAPLVLLMLGVSGAWMSNLTALAPYQGYFTVATLAFLSFGFWTVYWKPKKACAEGSYCATPAADRIIKLALWSATVLVTIAMTTELWAPLLS